MPPRKPAQVPAAQAPKPAEAPAVQPVAAQPQAAPQAQLQAQPPTLPEVTEQLKRLIHAASAGTLVVGDTGSGKSELVGTYAEWVWRTFHVPTRLYAFDPGGYPDDVLALIAVGIIEIWRPYTRDPEGHLGLPSETLQRAAQGWWPAEIDPETGASSLGCKLLPPSIAEPYARAYDGLTSMCDYSMVDMGHRSAQGTLGGEGSNMKTIQSGDLKMGSGNRASVGFTQNKVRDWVISSLSIPGLPTAPVFTALELKILDSESKLPLYGPKIAGQAKTGDVPAWFGATLGACLAKDERGRPQWRLYLRDYNYPATDLTPHKCKIRSSAQLPTADLAKLPDFLADAADEAGEVEKPKLVRFNLGYLFEALEEIRVRAILQAQQRYVDAPGLKKSTIGLAAAAPARTMAAAAVPGLVRASAPPLSPTSTVQKIVQAPAAAASPAPAPTSPPVPPAPAKEAVKKEEPGVPAPAAAPTAVGPTPQPSPAAPPAPSVTVAVAAPQPSLRPPPPGTRPIQRAPVAAAPAPPPVRVLPPAPPANKS